MDQGEVIRRLEIVPHQEGFRVNARESTDLEFKLSYDLAVFKKSLKTIAAFANKNGGYIIFGVRDRPKILVGIGNADIDEGILSELLLKNVSPAPEIEFCSIPVHGLNIGVIEVKPSQKPPVLALKDLQGGADEDLILRQGVIYTRRRAQTAAISGEEFTQLMLDRDERVRREIFSFLSHGRNIGFDKAIVAESVTDATGQRGMNFLIPREAAKDLNIIDRARLVQGQGAPAYEILGSVQLTVPNVNDPRQPLRANDSAILMQPEMFGIFWNDFPWNFSHLKKAADHLGFWDDVNGDQVHTGREQLSRTTIYYLEGRESIINFARQNPRDFIDVVGSQRTISEWRRQNPI